MIGGIHSQIPTQIYICLPFQFPYGCVENCGKPQIITALLNITVTSKPLSIQSRKRSKAGGWRPFSGGKELQGFCLGCLVNFLRPVLTLQHSQCCLLVATKQSLFFGKPTLQRILPNPSLNLKCKENRN